jgi:hypothetical protein
MKNIVFFFGLSLLSVVVLYAQENVPDDRQKKAMVALIDQYAQARETRDTGLLKKILTPDVDQLVSNGEWRIGIGTAVQGMLNSSLSNPGTRTLKVDKIRMVNAACAIVDCRYEIQNADGSVRKMWSSFVVVDDKKTWKIAAIRNMEPATGR